MDKDVEGEPDLITPLEEEVLQALVDNLGEKGLSGDITAYLAESFRSSKAPSVDDVLSVIRDSSGDKAI